MRAEQAWLAAEGQVRERPLSRTLAAAREAGRVAGVTRLAEVTQLDRIGVPVFQAIRPLALSLSVSQGKGLTPMAAQVSGLLEAFEFSTAERLPPAERTAALRDLDGETRAIWAGADRAEGAIRLDRDRQRGWIDGRDLMSGRSALLPWDLASLDFTKAPPGDAVPSSVGLASGNSAAEATVSAVAELVEHDLDACWHGCSAVERHRSQLDLASVTGAWPRRLIARLRAACNVHVWSLGQGWGVAAFRCALTEPAGSATDLAPAAGTGCHPDREVALLRALLEAAQTRLTLIAGARDDLRPADYRDGRAKAFELLFGALAFGRPPLGWEEVTTLSRPGPAEALDALLSVASRRSTLPVLAVEHRSEVPGIAVVRALAPGLADPDRDDVHQPTAPPTSVASCVTRARRAPVLFLGPTLDRAEVPRGIELRAPAICGDLAALLADPPPAVGLVDGCFELAPTVWHKEILDLLAHGVPVLGGASLGALRAAELHPFGMTGIGEIFRAYRDGQVRRDDAVMVSHAPAELGWWPLTLALVDAEAALVATDMPAAERRRLQRIVRTTPFRNRSWPACLARYAERFGRPPSVSPEALAAAPSVKREDARLLVAALAGQLTAPPARPRPPISCYYRDLLATLPPARDRGRAGSARDAPAA